MRVCTREPDHQLAAMPIAPPIHRPLGFLSAKARKTTSEKYRKSRHERGYTSRWDKARKGWLMHHPLCAAHELKGEVVAASVVDHVVPHRGDKKLFWSRDNWQSLCKSCHDTKTAREEGGFGNRKKELSFASILLPVLIAGACVHARSAEAACLRTRAHEHYHLSAVGHGPASIAAPVRDFSSFVEGAQGILLHSFANSAPPKSEFCSEVGGYDGAEMRSPEVPRPCRILFPRIMGAGFTDTALTRVGVSSLLSAAAGDARNG